MTFFFQIPTLADIIYVTSHSKWTIFTLHLTLSSIHQWQKLICIVPGSQSHTFIHVEPYESSFLVHTSRSKQLCLQHWKKPSHVSSNSQKAVYYLRNNVWSYISTTWIDKYDLKPQTGKGIVQLNITVAEVLEAMSQKRLLKFATTMIRLWVKPAGDSSLCVANGQKNQQRADTSSWIKKEPVFPIMKTGVNACSFLERKKQKYPSARGKTANCGNIHQVNVCWCQQISC